ncbi:MAG: DUF853 family protein [Neisseriaceae bacterium]|nr:MAG: DUF853 family protein [Neisseriaceae bacterium]
MTYIAIARNSKNEPIKMVGKMANRHGLIAGATGTGKSVTLRKMAESFSNQGVPVFLVDVKGDFSGMAKKGQAQGKVAQEMFSLRDDYYQAFPVTFWDVYAQVGIPFRVKISDMGAMLLSRLLGLNETQQGVLNLVFKVADDNGWLLIDIKDLRALLRYVADHANEYKTLYGNISTASVGAIQRQLLVLEQEGGDLLFGEPAIELIDLLQTKDTQGVVNILAGARLMRSPKIFSALLLWLLVELSTEFTECGDLDSPKFVLFFDEAHLLFDNASPALLNQVEQVVRLIRSKGVGVYFCSQSPLDLPQAILGQLGNRVQHALRAFTSKDQKAVQSVAETFRPNPEIDVLETISILGVGEALISFLDEKGIPNPVEYAYVLPPASQLTPLATEEQKIIIENNNYYAKYRETIDNDSTFEALLQENEKLQVNQKENTVCGTSTKNQAQAQDIPSPVTGFFRGLLGIRKHSNVGLGYDVSNQLGKKVKQGLFKSINGVIMGVMKRK